jgi:hypothetical protein
MSQEGKGREGRRVKTQRRRRGKDEGYGSSR